MIVNHSTLENKPISDADLLKTLAVDTTAIGFSFLCQFITYLAVVISNEIEGQADQPRTAGSINHSCAKEEEANLCDSEK